MWPLNLRIVSVPQFRLKGLYEWGKQWTWQHHTMIGLYVLLLLVVTGTVVAIIVDNVKYSKNKAQD